MANSDLKASVLMNLRSVTQSRKGGVPLRCLERDYKDLLGTPIPFRDLGYSSIQAFLTDIPDVISLKQKDGQLVAEGVADSTTAHIVSLVNRQKTAKGPPKTSRRPSTYPRRGAPPSKYSSRNVKSFSPKRNSYRSSSSFKPDNHHSKPQYHESTETRPKVFKPPTPPPPKEKHIPARKYDIPPRFLKLQQQKNIVEEKKVNNVDADFDIPRPVTPDSPPNYISEPISNNYIRSPRPLQTTRNNIERSEPISKKLESAATSKEYIEIYAKLHKLDLQYKSIMSGQKKRNRGYYSSLTLGQKKYDSYPEYAATAEAAEEIAAGVAVQAIQKDHLHLESCPETTIRNAEDVQKLISRIEEVVCEKPSGMFTNGIVHEYENNYHESLPENWLSLLQQSSILEIEELDVPYGRVPEGVNCIVRRAKFSSGSTTPSSLSELEQRSEISNDDSTPARAAIVRRDHLPAIPELTIPFGNQWFVYVVDVSKTIAARLIDYDEEFVEFLKKMRAFYSSEFLPAQEISEGLLYATCINDNFQRVLAQSIKESDLVECYYVDEGIFADVPKSYLQELHSDFWSFPYQAIHLTLDGLEDYPYKPDDLAFLCEKTLVALVKRWSTTVLKYFPDDPAVHKIIYSVELYDTQTVDDVNLNEIIKEKMLESLVVKLPKLSVSSGGYYLSHVENSGEIYLRNFSDDSWLEEQLEKLSPSFEEARLKAETIPHDMIFAAKYEDGLWYRAVLVQNPSSSLNPDQVEVFFIDYGNKSGVSSDEICKLQPFSEFLSSVGPQAIKCELSSALPSPEAEWTPDAVSKLVELAPFSEELLVRVINEDSELPQVNLYKRTYQNGDSFIISINESLANKPELFGAKLPAINPTARNLLSRSASFENNIPPPIPRPTNISKFTNSASLEQNTSSPTTPSNLTNDFKWTMTPDNLKSPDTADAHNLQPLRLAEVPDIGQMFDVFITMSANPDIFYIQPYKTNKETTALAIQMDQFYSTEDNLIEMELSLLKNNEYYAVKHTDGHWYRAQLQSIISDDPVQILVKYVDFGDLVTVNISQLQSLYSNFRHLPCQAIKASLAGIKPVEKDWRPLHCVEFKNMVDEKKFWGIVRKKTYKESRGNKVLELELSLIDVSMPNEDVYIHETLIEKGIARPI